MQESRKQKSLLLKVGWVDQVEVSVLVCDYWLGNVMKRSRHVEKDWHRPLATRSASKSRFVFGDTGHGR
jgi:hypothetical protein